MTERGPGQPPDDSALYVFAVCRRTGPGGVRRAAGRRGRPTAAPAAVRRTDGDRPDRPAADFTEEVWQARMATATNWNATHGRTTTWCPRPPRRCPTVPLPLATLYHGEERARQALLDETERFRAALERTAGHSEWGVKVYAADPPAPARGPPRPCGGAGRRSRPRTPGAGLAYLERKRGVQARREQRHEDALRLAETVDAAFGALAAAGRRLRLQHPRARETKGTSPGPQRHLPGAGPPRRRAPGTRADPAERDRCADRGLRVRGCRTPSSVRCRRWRATWCPGTTPEPLSGPIGVPLVDLLDRVLATGVVISGDLVIAIADVPLVRLSLHALLSSVNERVPAPWADGGPL